MQNSLLVVRFLLAKLKVPFPHEIRETVGSQIGSNKRVQQLSESESEEKRRRGEGEEEKGKKPLISRKSFSNSLF